MWGKAGGAGRAGPATDSDGGRAPAAWSGPPWSALGGWRLAAVGLGWLAGVALQLQQETLWPLAHHQALTAAGLAGLLVAMVGSRVPLRSAWARLSSATLLPALAMAALAFGSSAWRAEARLAERLPAALEGQDLLVTGIVAALPQAGPSGLRFVFEVEQARLRGAPVALPPRLALGWYDGNGDDTPLDDARADLRAGQRWRLPLRLRQPHGAMNPGGYDVELGWFEQGVGAMGTVRSPRWPTADNPRAELLAEAVAHPVERARQAIRDGIQRQVRDPRAAGVLAALVVGDQAAIEREDWDVFRQTGIAHLVAISGLHITMFAWIATWLVGGLWRRSPRLMRLWPAPQAGRFGGVALATGYALLAGWGVPAQRTVVMLASTAALRALGVRWPWLLMLLAAACAVTALDPWALLQAGFWLSFAAVGLLMLSEAPGADRPAGGWRAAVFGHLKAQAVASVGLAPLAMVFFQQISVVGLLANLVAIPVVTLLITPLALLGVLAAPLWSLAAVLVQGGVWALAGMAQWPLAVYTAAASPPWAAALGLAGAALAVMPLPWSLRALAVPLWLPLLVPPASPQAHGSFEWLAADIGQGTAVLVRTQAHLLVFDTGPQYARDGDAGLRVLLPLLRARGEPAVDLLLLSHQDADHVGGAASLLAAWPVRALSSSLREDHPLRQRGLPHRRCEAGQRWDWDGVQFIMLHPTPAEHEAARKPNAVSCVLRVADARGHSLLLTGDIEAPQEAALLARAEAQAPAGAEPADAPPAADATLASEVLVVPHHGSRTSSTAAFLRAVQPRVAVVQAGYRSRFGHPAPDVVARYEAQGISVVRSDRCGALRWRDGRLDCERDLRRRYWHWQPPSPTPPTD